MHLHKFKSKDELKVNALYKKALDKNRLYPPFSHVIKKLEVMDNKIVA